MFFSTVEPKITESVFVDIVVVVVVVVVSYVACRRCFFSGGRRGGNLHVFEYVYHLFFLKLCICVRACVCLTTADDSHHIMMITNENCSFSVFYLFILGNIESVEGIQKME